MTNEMKEIQKLIKQKQKETNDLQKQFDKLDLDYQAKIGTMYAGINIKSRKGSYILTRPDGLSVVVPKTKNSYNERNVFWYSGKKSEVAIQHTRSSHKKIAIWLRDYEREAA
jgi:hypothetical protein